MKKILGIGNALVDIMTCIDEDHFLDNIKLPKGSMQLVDDKFVDLIGPQIAAFQKNVSAGGSAANTINGLAKLGIPCGFVGVVGNDEMGQFFATDMKNAGIALHLQTSADKSGVAVAFVSPDSERTFATFLGAALGLSSQHLNEDVFKMYDLIHIEGYLVQNYDLVKNIMLMAKKHGLRVSLDLASYNVVEANLEFIKFLLSNYVDIVFANEEEAKAYTGQNPREALDILAQDVDIAVVKTGKHGSIIKQGQMVYTVKAIDSNCIDTTGAGDLYASGFFYGLTNNQPLEMCGQLGSLLSGKVIEVLGSKMDDDRWEAIRKNIEKSFSLT